VKQYDLCQNKGRGAKRSPYFLVIQRDMVSALPTRLVAPVLRLQRTSAVTRVMVAVEIGGESLHISLPETFSIDRTMLGPVASNLSHLHDDIVRALDMLVTG
jgi:CcdB protein